MTQIPRVAVKNKFVSWDWGFYVIGRSVCIHQSLIDDHQQLAVPSLTVYCLQEKTNSAPWVLFSQHAAAVHDPGGSWRAETGEVSWFNPAASS